MSGIKISALPAATSAQLTDVFPADQSGPITKKISLAQVAALLSKGFVDLNPSGNQVIVSNNLALQAGNMTALQGSFNSGSIQGGVSGSFKAFAINELAGSNNFLAANNAGNYSNVLTNASTTASRTWTLPDESGTVALTSGLTDYATKVQVQQSAFNVGIDTGVADAYVVNLTPAVAALTDGMLITFTPSAQNMTYIPTLTVNGITKNIFAQSSLTLFIGDMSNSVPAFLIYSEMLNAWILLNCQISNATGLAITNSFYTLGTDSGTASDYIVELDCGVGPYFSPIAGTMVNFLATNDSNGMPTLNVNNSSQYLIISQNGEELTAGALKTDKYAMVIFGTNNAGQEGWILLNPQNVYIPSSRTAGFKPVSVSDTSQALVAGEAYIFNNAAATTGTLPLSADSVIGDTIKIKGRSSAPWIIQANTGQIITNGATQSSSAGTATSNLGTDSLQLMYVASNEWSIDWSNSVVITLA